MKAFIHARDILLDIIDNDHNFSQSLRQVFGKDSVDMTVQPLVRSLTSCELHHHLLLEHVVNKHFPNLTLAQRLLIQVVIGNNVFIKRIPYADAIEFINGQLLSFGIDEQEVEQFLLDVEPGKQLIDESIDPRSSQYLSLRFNTPEWLVTMWQKHFGIPNTYKILKSNNQAVIQACRVNDMRSSVDQVLEADPHFIRGPIPNTVIFQGREPLKHRSVYQDNLVFQQRLAVTDILNKFDFSSMFGDVLIVETRPHALYIELPIATRYKNRIQVATNSVARKLDIQKAIRSFGLENILVFESTPKLLISHVSHPQDFVIVVSNCSKFDLIRSLPDFFIHFKQEDLDQLIAEQKETLEEASKFVAEGGLFSYGVNTLNKKEGQSMIATFLSEHPDFILVHEKQYFPFDELNTALYMAVMRKRLPANK